jgi:prolipoprotein diacylglyceryltransferase
MGSTWEGNSTMIAVYLAIFVLALVITYFRGRKRRKAKDISDNLCEDLFLVGWIVQTLETNLWHLQFGEQSYSDKAWAGLDSNEASIIAWSVCLMFVAWRRLKDIECFMWFTRGYVVITTTVAWSQSFPHPKTQIVEVVWTTIVLLLLLTKLWWVDKTRVVPVQQSEPRSPAASRTPPVENVLWAQG